MDQSSDNQVPKGKNDDIPEVVPGWLQALLDKHKEKSGPLAGEPEFNPFASGPGDLADRGEDDISGVLRQAGTWCESWPGWQ